MPTLVCICNTVVVISMYMCCHHTLYLHMCAKVTLGSSVRLGVLLLFMKLGVCTYGSFDKLFFHYKEKASKEPCYEQAKNKGFWMMGQLAGEIVRQV